MVEAQGLLHGGAGEGGVVADAGQVIGAAQEVEEHEAQGVHGRVGAADDDRFDEADELGLAEAGALLLDMDEVGEQVGAGSLAALGDQGADVAVAGGEAADQVVALVAGERGVDEQQAGAREAQEAGLHRGGDGEQAADHPQRDVVDHRREVDDLVVRQAGEGVAGDRGDGVAQALDGPRREAGVDESTQAQVIGLADLKQAVLGGGSILGVFGDLGSNG
jgi:hypothetical protein